MTVSKNKENNKLESPLMLSKVAAGFPSPAEDYEEESLDLNKYLVKNRVSTFFVRVKGTSMKNANISEGDLLVVDRSIVAQNGNVVVAVVNGEFTVKRVEIKNGKVTKLIAENEEYKPIIPKNDEEIVVWGVVTACVHKL